MRPRLPRGGRRLPRSPSGGSVRGADQIPGRSAPRRRAARAGVAAAARLEDSQRHAARVPPARAGRSRRRSRLRQRARARLEPRSGSRDDRDRHQPVLLRGRATRRAPAPRRPPASAVCRWHVHQGLVARRARALVARRAAGNAQRGQSRARAGRRDLRLYPRAQECARGRGLALDQPARARARAARADRHAPGTAAQVRSPQPARRRARPRTRRARVRISHRPHHVLHADRRRLRREHPHAHGREGHGQACRPPHRSVRQPRRRRCPGHPRSAIVGEGTDRQKPGDLRRAAGAVLRDETRPPALRPDHVGAVLCLAGQGPAQGSRLKAEC